MVLPLLNCTRLQERDLDRINTISGDDSKRAKIKARIESLQSHRTEVQREKQTVNEYLYSNNESVGRVQAEINRECEKTAGEWCTVTSTVCLMYIALSLSLSSYCPSCIYYTTI